MVLAAARLEDLVYILLSGKIHVILRSILGGRFGFVGEYYVYSVT